MVIYDKVYGLEQNQYISKIKNAYNVGVDIIGFMPRTLKEILESKK